MFLGLPTWLVFAIRGSIVVSISACHAEDPGSIPGRGVLSSTHALRSQVEFEPMRSLEPAMEGHFSRICGAIERKLNSYHPSPSFSSRGTTILHQDLLSFDCSGPPEIYSTLPDSCRRWRCCKFQLSVCVHVLEAGGDSIAGNAQIRPILRR